MMACAGYAGLMGRILIQRSRKLDLGHIDLLAIVQRDVVLKRAASTNGGEWAGPCPFCGGRDRFRVWPSPANGNPRAWCRQCGFNGDALAYVMARDNVAFVDACQGLGIALDTYPGRTGRTCIKSPVQRMQDTRTVSAEREWAALA